MKKSIRTKLMALLLAATIVPMALSMVISDFYIKNQVTGKAIAENRSLLEVGKDNILNYMNTLNRNSLSVYNSINSPTSLYAIIERFTAPGADAATADLAYRTTIYQHLLNMYQANKEIHQIHLQIGRGEDSWSYLLARGLFRSGHEAAGGWPAGRTDDPTPFMEPAHKSASYALDSRRSISPRDVITLRRPIIRTPSDRVIGYLSIDVQLTELGDICGRLALSEKEKLYLLDRGGNVVCGAGPENGDSVQHAGWTRKLLADAGGSGDFKWSDSSFSGYVVYDTLQTQFMDWIVAKQLPYAYLYQNAQGIRTINTLIIALSLVVAVIATLVVSVQFTSPIKKLIARMNLVQAGKWSAGADARLAKSSDEFGVLERRFGTMVATIEELINREYKLALANKTNQLKAMQAQINPHFLNNALQSIGTLALQSNAPKVYGLVAAMARMMRYSMNTEESVVPLSAELAHAKAYLELQKQRFGEDLQAYYEIDPETTDVAVPKMLLQPLVENYFKHGYEPAAVGGTEDGGASQAGAQLHIRAWLEREREWLCVEIADNGKGMEPRALERLRARLNRAATEDGTGGQIGLANVHMRLRLYFGEEAGMEVDASPGGGFKAALRIPLRQAPFDEKEDRPANAQAPDAGAEREETR